MIYSIGASYNPDMSRYSRNLKRNLADISFAYKLNTWGPTPGPSMIPANNFSSGLAGPFTWIEGLLGLASPQDIAKNAQDILDEAVSPLSSLQAKIQNIRGQASTYQNVTNAGVQAKAQAVVAQATGLVNTYQNIQNASDQLTFTLLGVLSDPALTKSQAQELVTQAEGLAGQVSSLERNTDSLEKNFKDLVHYANSGPGLGESLESAAVASISTLTWIVGGGLLVYFLAPSFIPRLIKGVRKS